MTKFKIGFLIFPNITQLDLTGPLQVLSRVPESALYTVAKDGAPVSTDCGFGLVPNCTLKTCPDLDLICIPGGFGVVDVMRDQDIIDFVRRQASRARYISAVCTGTFVLGAAGLLKGRQATTHWAYTDLLPLVGAVYQKARVVFDGNVITAGGVTSGIDFGLSIAAELAGQETAQSIQLSLEYDPAPPFDAGHPDRAPAEVVAHLNNRYETSRSAYRKSIASILADT